jgi:hypothetical protein
MVTRSFLRSPRFKTFAISGGLYGNAQRRKSRGAARHQNLCEKLAMITKSAKAAGPWVP